jgi:hypothetical protein
MRRSASAGQDKLLDNPDALRAPCPTISNRNLATLPEYLLFAQATYGDEERENKQVN